MSSLQAKGRAYENRAVRAIRREILREPCRSLCEPRAKKSLLYHGQWIRYTDAAGTANAQPDLYLHFKTKIVLFEFKLSRTQRAEYQLLDLYGPLLHHIFHLPLVYISCFLNPGPGYEVHPSSPQSLEDALLLSPGVFVEWHLRT